jgi:GGDEF domain-containing protein
VAAWDGRETLDELLRRADAALYAAKAAGGGRVESAHCADTLLLAQPA